MARLEEFVTSPITALFVALVFGALALSGRFNVTLTQAFLGIAWLVAVFGLRSQPYPLWIGGSAIVGGVLLILAFYFTPQAVPQNIGFLQSIKTTLFSAESNTVRRMVQFGPNGPTIGSSAADYRLDPGAPFLPYLKESHLTVEWIDGQIKVSTDIRDKSGNLIVRLIRNEWQVAPPRMFDRNYSQNALEVLGPNGDVVLQIKILSDRIQILGEWWDRDGRGIRIAGTGNEIAMRILSREINSPDPKIEPMFKYPSDRHLGELVA